MSCQGCMDVGQLADIFVPSQVEKANLQALKVPSRWPTRRRAHRGEGHNAEYQQINRSNGPANKFEGQQR